jgi:hypothetical protein
MTEEKPKDFGRRAPPVVLQKPKSPVENERPAPEAERLKPAPAAQKRSLAVSLALMGALSLGAYETFDWIDKKLNCKPDPANPEEQICKHSNGSTYRRSSGSRWSSGSSSGSGSHWFGSSGSSSTHGVSFGGFGHSGGFSGGG